MQIFINDEPVECPESSTISTLLIQQNIPPVNMAVALNDRVISKTQWEQTMLSEGCHLIIIKAVQGG